MGVVHVEAMKWLKELLLKAPTLSKPICVPGSPIFVTTYTSLNGLDEFSIKRIKMELDMQPVLEQRT